MIAPRQAPGPAAQIHTNLPADSVTVTHWYKQNVYDPADNKIGEIEVRQRQRNDTRAAIGT
jgi:hypothetical protein